MSKIISFVNRLANKIINHTDWYKQDYWKGVTKFWGAHEYGLDIINLGSGAGVNAFNYANLQIKGENWALGPQSLVHDFNILKNYFSYIKPEGVVIITVCPFSCLISNYSKEHNFRYYTILHPATIIGFDDKERTKALTIKANPFKSMPYYCVKRTIKEILRKIVWTFVPRKISKDMDASANSMIENWKKQFGINDLTAPLSEKHKKEQLIRMSNLEEIVQFCKERSLKPVIVIPPMHHSLSKMFPKEFLKNYICDFVNGIDAPLYNYMYNAQLNSDTCYKTALFMNELGSSKFTSMLISELKSDKLL